MTYDKIDRIKMMFKNMNPDFRQLTQLRMMARQLKSKAPSNSSMLVTFEKNQNFNLSRCHIRSLVGVFVAESYEDCPLRSFEEIVKKITAQLNIWKQRRFLSTDDAS